MGTLLSSELCHPGHEFALAPPARAHAGDIASIAVQFGYTPKDDTQLHMLAVPDGARCSHGFPQAFVYSPFGSEKPNAGGCRLSCPLLVQAVDELENGGGLREFRKERLEKSHTWRSRLRDTNLAHAAHRCALVGLSEAATGKRSFGVEFVRRILRSGVAGMSIYEVEDATKRHDVKCFHAQLADWLCRVRGQPTDEHLNPPSSRIIGRAIAVAAAAGLRSGTTSFPATAQTSRQPVLVKEEQERRASLFGLRGEGLRCWTACDPNHVRKEGDFTYEAQRNQIKLMRRKRRRNEAARAQRQTPQSTLPEPAAAN